MAEIKVGKHYQMIRKIGSGAFGEIFEGNQQLVLPLFRQEPVDKRASCYKDGKSKADCNQLKGTGEVPISAARVRAQLIQSFKGWR
jgi:hypothetical protein